MDQPLPAGAGTPAPATPTAPSAPLSAPAPAPAPVALAAPPVPVVQTAPLPPPAVGEPKEGDEPAWAKSRLERSKEAGRKEILRELGIEDPKQAKAAIDAHLAHIEAQKTELQKAQERAALVDPLMKERDDYRARIEGHASVALQALTPEQRAAVERIAGKDPVRIADAIETLRPTWASTGAPPPLPPAPPPPPPLAAGANTAPPPGGPPPAASPTENKLAQYESLQKSNPVVAANYLLQNYAAISAAQKARG